MRDLFKILLLLLSLPAAFKAGEWLAKTYPKMFNVFVVSYLVTIAVFACILAVMFFYESGYKAGRTDCSSKPQ